MSTAVSTDSTQCPGFTSAGVLAVIGGTGIEDLPGARALEEQLPPTPYGRPSAAVVRAHYEGVSLLFLQRHGGAANLPPHAINYRANLWALHAMGATAVLAFNAVGGITAQMRPGRLVIPDQIIDYTWGREHTFDEGGQGEPLQHVEFTEPYCPALRAELLAAATQAELPCVDGAVYGVTQGPRLETAAEIRRMARDGCDVVGMTAMPEAVLARELGLGYASICMVVNAAAGLSEQPLSMALLRATIAEEARRGAALFRALIAQRQSTMS